MSFATEGLNGRKKCLSMSSRLSLSSLATAPLLSTFEGPVKRRSTRDSPLLLFDALHEDGMAVKKLGNRVKSCSCLLLVASPAWPAAVALTFFTLNWFLLALALLVSQALLGSTGMRIGKKRKIKKASHFAWCVRLFSAVLLCSLLLYQAHAFLATLTRVSCKEAVLHQVCAAREGWDYTHLLLLCGLPLLNLFLAMFLAYVLKVTKSFERALVNDLIGLNAAWNNGN